MESEGEDLENIFEEYEANENDGEGDTAENVQVTNETSGERVPVPKRIIKNPRLKFNAERLCGERGIPILADHFKNVKFKGVGHEKEDLDKLLSKLEHWTHRLFPSMKFEDCLHHIEKLGKKRPVQTCLRKIRLDMPILNGDFVKDDEDDVKRIEDDVNGIEDSEPIEVDPFDRLIEESRDTSNPSISVQETISSSMPSPCMQSSYGIGQVLGSTSGSSSLTEEQRERMERNKMLAAERRKARLAALQQNSSEIQSVNEAVTPSQNVSTDNLSNTYAKSPNSSFTYQGSTLNTSGDLPVKSSHDIKLSAEEVTLELNNQNNSENLGLDDLLDLVDEEESVSNDNATAASSEACNIASSYMDKSEEFSHDAVAKVNLPSSEQNAVSISDNTSDKILVVSDKVSKTVNEEDLGIESLLDSVNEDSENIQSTFDAPVKDTSVSETGKENMLLNSDEESNAMIIKAPL